MKSKVNTDVLILGGGVAGITAATYTMRAKVKTIVLEKNYIEDKEELEEELGDYPTFISLPSPEILDVMKKQISMDGGKFANYDSIEKIFLTDDNKIIETENEIYIAKTVIVTTGVDIIKIPIKNESTFSGKGIHYSALIELGKYRDKVVATVGEGDFALEEALYLAQTAKKVYVIRKADTLKGKRNLLKEVSENKKIKILYNTELLDAYGSTKLEGIYIKNILENKERKLKLDGLFAYMGKKPKVFDVKKYLDLSADEYIIVDELMRTNVDGVFAAGDVVEKCFRNISSSVADATIAALSATKYLESLK